ncbi:MAG TPA: hypothetical protein VFV38_24630 [Ktedonobacteraceae bacterium]|nr:hypothetical protein [Ktedonobacteraceae bacterium]
MRDEVKRDLAASSADFAHIVWPVLRERCKELRGSELGLVEGHPDQQLHFDLDVCAGIDAYQRGKFALRGIAARVQWWKNYRTFTVRISRPNGSATEYKKRLEILKHREEGYLYPFWSIHAYLSEPGGDLLSVGVARTTELYQYIEQRERNGPKLPRHQASCGGEWFFVVSWEEYRQSGKYLFTSSRKRIGPDE